MLDEIMAHLRNYFVKNVYTSRFEIKDGVIVSPSSIQVADGQYIKIVGSVFNDGVHIWPPSEMTDEIFDGEIWALAVPPALVALAEDIKVYEDSDMAKQSAYKSESFAGYSYTKNTNADGTPISWQKAFAKKLNRWRKL